MTCIKEALKKVHIALVFYLAVSGPVLFAQGQVPDWCRALPRLEYKRLRQVPVSDSWFEVFEVSPAVFALYEPHQAEETIGYLIVGDKRAVLFDTGMGISDIRQVTAALTKLPIIVLNSHTHNDHVGGNWQFATIYAMDTDFTRANARGSREDAQSEVAPDQICGELPKGFDRKTYATRPWKITAYVHDGDHIDLGGRSLEIIATPGHTPGSICFAVEGTNLLFTGDTLFPGGPGNTSFEGGDFDTIIQSIDRRIFGKFGADTKVLPGHGVATTVGSESPHLQEWVDRGW